jgi:hypothetical protein
VEVAVKVPKEVPETNLPDHHPFLISGTAAQGGSLNAAAAQTMVCFKF